MEAVIKLVVVHRRYKHEFTFGHKVGDHSHVNPSGSGNETKIPFSSLQEQTCTNYLIILVCLTILPMKNALFV